MQVEDGQYYNMDAAQSGRKFFDFNDAKKSLGAKEAEKFRPGRRGVNSHQPKGAGKDSYSVTAALILEPKDAAVTADRLQTLLQKQGHDWGPVDELAPLNFSAATCVFKGEDKEHIFNTTDRHDPKAC
jgi:hypothetical protein